MRELGRRASTTAFGDDSVWAAVVRWWGCCAANRVADGAGTYRRIASGLAVGTVPLLGLFAVLLVDERFSTSFALAHAVLAVGCAWLARDLFQEGSVLGTGGRPRASAVALLAGIALLVVVAPAGATTDLGPPTALVPALAVLVGGVIVLTAGERQGNRLLSVFGRLVVVAGAVLVGALQLAHGLSTYPDAPDQAVGFVSLAAVLMVMGWCEARALHRGAALYRTLARR